MTPQPYILPSKPPADDPDRRAHQAQVKQAIVEGQNFALTYLLGRVQDRRPYDNYRVPDDLAVFEFTVKGVLRLELLHSKDKALFAGWRRLFGSNTKAQELSTWRSRIYIKAFDSLAGVRAYVEADPLLTWSGRGFPWRDELPAEAWYVLFQVQDVLIKGDKERWADLFGAFLMTQSRVLKLVPPLFDALPPAGKGDTP
jgi:hypothetical protein